MSLIRGGVMMGNYIILAVLALFCVITLIPSKRKFSQDWICFRAIPYIRTCLQLGMRTNTFSYFVLYKHWFYVVDLETVSNFSCEH